MDRVLSRLIILLLSYTQLFSSPIKKVQNMTTEILENGLEQLKNITLVPIQEQLDTFR